MEPGSFGLKPRSSRLGRMDGIGWSMADDTHEMATTASLVVARDANEDAHGWKRRTARTEEMEVGAKACAKEPKSKSHTTDHTGRRLQKLTRNPDHDTTMDRDTICLE